VRQLPQGACVARLRVFAAVKEGVYVALTKRLMFQHKGVTGPLDDYGSAAAAHRCAPVRAQSDLAVTRDRVGWWVQGSIRRRAFYATHAVVK
jgi:hypothetical protein